MPPPAAIHKTPTKPQQQQQQKPITPDHVKSAFAAKSPSLGETQQSPVRVTRHDIYNAAGLARPPKRNSREEQDLKNAVEKAGAYRVDEEATSQFEMDTFLDDLANLPVSASF